MNKPILEKNRLEAFSDGVIAIIITLLVLEIKVPHIEGAIDTRSIIGALTGLLPKFLSWALSFFMVLIMWVNHHRIFNDIKHSDNGLMWVNGFLLFTMSFVPFPTAMMGDYFSQPFAMFFFGICLAILGLSFFILRRYLANHSELLKENVDLAQYKRLMNLTLISPLLYTTGALAAFVNVYISYAFYLIVPFYFVFFGSKK